MSISDKNGLNKEKEIAISVSGVSKTFRIPHEKINSLRGAFINAFKKNSYEEFKALDDVSFEVKKGEFFGIIGRNGSGKSTLLKILAGIYEADKGKVKINGLISPFLELGIGFNPELSGRDNIYLNASVLGLSEKQIDEKFDDIVKFSELERFIDQKLKNYSSGMQVRLAFSVSIHANRDILLMDEVLAVGDTNFQKKSIDVFNSYKYNNKTVILVTHDIGSVREYCNRAMLLDNGRIIKLGKVDEVCDEYVIKNMSRESRNKLIELEKIKKNEIEIEKELKKRLKNKNQCIFDAIAYDKKGKELKEITREDNFFIEVIVDIKEICEDLNLAIQIFDKNNDYFISGNNSEMDNFKFDWKIGRNKIKVSFEKSCLNNGLIYIKAVLFKYHPGKNIILDEFIYKNIVKVQTLKSSRSSIFINHKWESIK
jgi:ABC-2 type transport system ATP-binding protein